MFGTDIYSETQSPSLDRGFSARVPAELFVGLCWWQGAQYQKPGPRLLDLMRSCQSRARTSRKLLLIPERSLFGEEAMLIPARQARSSKCPRNHSCHCRYYKSIIRSVKGSLRSLLNESTSWKKGKMASFSDSLFLVLWPIEPTPVTNENLFNPFKN